MDKESIFLDKWLLCVHLQFFFLKSVFFGKKSIMRPFTLHRINAIVWQPPSFLDHLLFFSSKRVVFWAKTPYFLDGEWFLRDHLLWKLKQCLLARWLSGFHAAPGFANIYIFGYFFFKLFWELCRYIIFGFHAASRCPNIFICAFC